jgi:putative transposase
MQPLSFKRHRFPPEIIRHSVWLFARFTLSYRDIEEQPAERGLDASYETVRRWFVKFGYGDSLLIWNISRCSSVLSG